MWVALGNLELWVLVKQRAHTHIHIETICEIPHEMSLQNNLQTTSKHVIEKVNLRSFKLHRV